jgi:hypothetical protein
MREAQIKKFEREEDILLSLSKLDYLTRSQIQRLHKLSGDRNARRVLTNMRDFIASFRLDAGESIYYLNKAGRERIGSDTVRQKSLQVSHFLMRNDVYIHYQPDEWKNEAKFSIGETGLTVIADAYFRHNGRRHFLEVDHLQLMQKNREKIERYRKLKDTGVFQEKIRYFPRLVWVTTTESRKKQLAEWCGISGLDTVVHLWDDIR